MDVHSLSPAFAVSPQIAPADLPALKAAGFEAVICNRPDEEVPPDMQAEAMAQAAAEAGLGFVLNPVQPGMMTQENVARQAAAAAEAGGPVLAYCASGTRSTVVWMLGQVAAGVDPDDALAAAREAGYALDMLRPQLQAVQAAR